MHKSQNKSTEKRRPVKSCIQSWSGYLFAILAAIATASGSLFLKLTEEEKLKVVVLRSGLQFVVVLPLITYQKTVLHGPNLHVNILLIIRGLLGPVGLTFLAYSLNYINLGDAMAIFNTFPALVVFFACVCLKESCGIFNLVVTFITMIGFILVAQPSFIFGGMQNQEEQSHNNFFRLLGAFLAFMSAVALASACIIVRKLGPKVPVTLSLLYSGWEGVLYTLVFAAIARIDLIPCFQSLGVMLGCGIFYGLGQAFQTLALQREKAGPITLIQSSQVLFSFILEYFVLGELPNLLTAIGSGLITISCVALSIKSIIKVLK